MIRRILLSLFGLALWVSFFLGVVALFTAIDFASLSTKERALVALLVLPGPSIVALVAIIRRFQARDFHTAVEGLGLGTEPIDVTYGFFEAPSGARTPIWQVTVRGEKSTPSFVVLARDAPLPDYAAAMTEVPSSLPAHLVLRVADPATPIVFDRGDLAAIASLRSLVQLRVRSGEGRLLLARPVQDLRELRAGAALLVRHARGRELALPDVDRPLVDRRPMPVTIAGFATLLSFASLLVLGFIAPDDEGYEDFVLERVRACPLAMRALGPGVRRKAFGLQPSSQNGRRQTSHVLVQGARAEGDITVEAYVRTRHTSPTEYPLYDAVMEVSGERIEILSCADDAQRGMRGVRSFAGHVVRGTITPGTECSVTLGSVGGARACRLEVRCGGRALYGATPDLGYAQCWTVREEGREHVVARDLPRGAPRAEPFLDFDEREHHVSLFDERRTMSVEIALDP